MEVEKNSDLDDAVENFKEKVNRDVPNDGVSAVKTYVGGVVKEEFGTLTKRMIDDIKNIKEAVKMYTKVATNVRKRQDELETQIKTSIGILKFLFGGGVLLTVINIIVMIIIAVVNS